MREIKFRGRDDASIWHYGDLVTMTVGRPLIIDSVIVDNDIGEPITVAPDTVGQFTGLYDCTRSEEYPEGRPIYEGDIVKADNWVGVVMMREGCWCADNERSGDCLQLYSWVYKLAVIGNVHDSPELLEVSNGRL